MIINIPKFAQDHFWEEPPPDSMEFWGFKFKPHCQMGEEIMFRIDGRVVARAEVAFIESPGNSRCRGTGKFEKHWKVFWHPRTFVDLRERKTSLSNWGPLFSKRN